MSRKCDICGKGALAANSISHAHNVNHKRQLPNIKVVHINVSGNRKKIKTCTSCLRSGKVYGR